MKGFALSMVAWSLLAACLQDEQLTQALGPAEVVTVTARQVLFSGDPIDTLPTTFAAYQQADGPWLPLSLRDGEYSVEIEAGRYAMAMGLRSVLSPGDMDTFLQISYGTTDEMTEMTFYQDFVIDTPYRLLLDVRGVGADERAAIYLDRASHFLPDGVHTIEHTRPEAELCVVLQRVSGWGLEQRLVPLKIFRLGNVNLRDSTPIVVDFQLPLAAPLTFPATVDGQALVPVSSSVLTDRSSIVLGRQPGVFYALPPALRRPTDMARVSAGAPKPSGVGWQSVGFLPLAPGPQTLELSPSYDMPAPTLISSPYPRLAFPLAHGPSPLGEAEYEYSFSSGAWEEHASLSTSWSITFSDGWISAAPTASYQVPIFYGLPGWSVEMAPPRGAEISWYGARNDANTRTAAPGQLQRISSTTGTLGN